MHIHGSLGLSLVQLNLRKYNEIVSLIDDFHIIGQHNTNNFGTPENDCVKHYYYYTDSRVSFEAFL